MFVSEESSLNAHWTSVKRIQERFDRGLLGQTRLCCWHPSQRQPKQVCIMYSNDVQCIGFCFQHYFHLSKIDQNSSQTLSQTCAFKRAGVSLNWDSPSHGIPCSFGSPKFWETLIVVLATRKQQSSWCAPPLLRFLGEYDEWTDNGTNLWVSKWVQSTSWGFLWLPVLLCILIETFMVFGGCSGIFPLTAPAETWFVLRGQTTWFFKPFPSVPSALLRSLLLALKGSGTKSQLRSKNCLFGPKGDGCGQVCYFRRVPQASRWYKQFWTSTSTC